MLTVSNRNLGPNSDPDDIRTLRQHSYDSNDSMGQPVILKHRWNERDLRNGLTTRCPYHDSLYNNDLATCPFCFGTSYTGGFADGILTYATLADSRVDTFRLSDQGILIHDTSPEVNFPWKPVVGDNDLMMTIEIDPNTKQVAQVYELYMLRQAIPVTVRGFYEGTERGRPYVVSQQAQVDIVPYGDVLWNVPIVFDYNNLPDPTQPVNIPPGYLYAQYQQTVKIIGIEEGAESSFDLAVRVAVDGTNTDVSQDVRIVGAPIGTHINF